MKHKRRIWYAGILICALAVGAYFGFTSRRGPTSPPQTDEGILVVAYQGGPNSISQILARGHIYAVDVAGNEIPVPSVVAERVPSEMQWSPDGQWIVYSTRYENARAGGVSQIYLMPADGTNQAIQISHAIESALNPAWAPNGLSIAYYDGGVMILSVKCILEQTEECRLEPKYLVDGAEPAWSPDGEFMAYSEVYRGGGIFVIPVDGTREPVFVGHPSQYCRQPQWSPDGAWLAFYCTPGAYIAKPDGSELTLIAENAFFPRWSPTGEYLAFVGGSELDPSLGNPVGRGRLSSTGRPLSTAIFLVKPDGTSLRRLTDNDYQVILQFLWLPANLTFETPP